MLWRHSLLTYLFSPVSYAQNDNREDDAISLLLKSYTEYNIYKQESRAVARKPHDAAAVRFALKFADNNHSKFKSSRASKARLQSSKRASAKQNLT